MQIRIYYDSTDAGRIVYHTEYIKFCERARSEIFFKNGIFFENDGYIVKELKATYLSPAKLGDIINVKTKVLNYSKAKVNILQEIYKIGVEKKNLNISTPNPLNPSLKIFILEVTVVYMNNGKISKIPQHHIKLFNEYAQYR